MIGMRQVWAASVMAAVAAGWLAAGAARAQPAQTPAGPGVAQALEAGAAAVDITPTELPVIVNGGFLEGRADKVNDRLHARAVVLKSGQTRAAIVVVDNCLMPRDLLDQAKALACRKTGIPVERIVISATHCHSAPSTTGALGSRADEKYCKFLPPKIAEAVEKAAALEPARAGWAETSFEFTACRRWIRRGDKIGTDPFGERTIRAMMHPGYNNPDYICPSGAVDRGVTILSIQSADGRPIALLANYAMHYFGAAAISADYYGRFAARLPELIGLQDQKRPMVAMLSQGTSGDQWYGDYGKAPRKWTIQEYAEAFSQCVLAAYKRIEHRPSAVLAMEEAELTLARRVPDARRLAWAKDLAAKIGDRLPKTQTEVYALEALYLAASPTARLRLQALRVGDFALVASPAEIFGLTGLKLKAYSPLTPTMVIELANGADGYIPPPEQHVLGGYTTWPARSAGLEVQAEPKIVDALLGLLEKVAGRSRREQAIPDHAYSRAVLASKPAAYWAMEEFSLPRAQDRGGQGRHGTYEGGLAMHLEGVPMAAGEPPSRTVHFAGGCVKTQMRGLGKAWTAEAWVWAGVPAATRKGPSCLMRVGDVEVQLTGAGASPGRLVVCAKGAAVTGRSAVSDKEWHHLAVVRQDDQVAAYLDGQAEPDLSGALPAAEAAEETDVVLGGSGAAEGGLEGRLDEVAIYGRALAAEEIHKHYRSAK